MLANKLSSFDAIKPIPPGNSWTDAPKTWPWQNPPKFVNIDEVAQQYIDRMSSDAVINSTLDMLDTKVPLASMAEALMLSGVAAGVHTIDAGILVMPVIIEMLKTAADIHGVEYKMFAEDELEKSEISNRVINSAIKKASSVKEVTPEEAASTPIVELGGLMTRKSTTTEVM